MLVHNPLFIVSQFYDFLFCRTGIEAEFGEVGSDDFWDLLTSRCRNGLKIVWVSHAITQFNLNNFYTEAIVCGKNDILDVLIADVHCNY